MQSTHPEPGKNQALRIHRPILCVVPNLIIAVSTVQSREPVIVSQAPPLSRMMLSVAAGTFTSTCVHVLALLFNSVPTVYDQLTQLSTGTGCMLSWNITNQAERSCPSVVGSSNTQPLHSAIYRTLYIIVHVKPPPLLSAGPSPDDES